MEPTTMSHPIPLRLAPKLRARLERLVPAVTAALPSHRISLTAVMRMAVERGVDALEIEFGVKP